MKTYPITIKYSDYLRVKTITGYIGFFCKNCFKEHYFKVKDFREYDVRPSYENYGFGLHISFPRYNFICQECGFHNEFEGFIDPNILKCIALLNKKHYITRCCCEGHYLTDDAYIQFEERYEYIEKNKPPYPWGLDKNSYYCTKDDNKVICTTLRKKYNIKINLEKRISLLYEYIRKLPFNEI